MGHAKLFSHENINVVFKISYSLKINELIQFPQTGVYFFQSNSCQKILVFDLNNNFIFQQTLTVIIQLILEF